MERFCGSSRRAQRTDNNRHRLHRKQYRDNYVQAPVHLFTDADNTLWDTNSVFADAQLAMLRDIEAVTSRRAPEAEDRGLAFLRRIDQRIAVLHQGRLRYPPALLATGLGFALEGEDPDRAAERAASLSSPASPRFAVAVQRFIQRLQALPPLRDRVREGLSSLANSGIGVTVVTEECLERCRHFLDVHDLAPLIRQTISIQKTPDAYRQLKREAGDARVVMVGDQLDRDIRYAREAGFETFFFPSAFVPYWLTDADRMVDHEIAHFDEIVPFVQAQTAFRRN